MQSKNRLESYPINQSPLYRMRGKGQFEKALKVNWDSIDKLFDPENYRVWCELGRREIQHPIGFLAQVHKRISVLFRRINLPCYVFSRKGRSYADNARRHVGKNPLVKTDIQRFFPSTTRTMVYRMFVADFECSEDIAGRLADICCYRKEHLPTGSPLSGIVAFFAAHAMFDEIAAVAESVQCKMTVYVDDVTISGDGATKRVLEEVRGIIRKHGYKAKRSKSKTYAAGAVKVVTGVVIVGDETRLPNSRHKKIWIARKELVSAEPEQRWDIQRRLKGRLLEAAQVLGGESD